MKKIVSTSSLRVLFTLLAAVMTLSASAQVIQIYKTSSGITSDVATYTNGTTDTYKAVLRKTAAAQLVTKLTGITSTNGASIHAGASTTMSVGTVTPAGASSTVTWSVSPSGAGVTISEAGVVTTTTSATVQNYTITAKATDGSNVTSDAFTLAVTAPLVTTGTAKATLTSSSTTETDVNWVQLWEDGPKFAAFNVGATSVNEYGGRYCWGASEVQTSSNYNTYNKGTAVLTGDNDTATKLWGSNWRMPTNAELNNLRNYSDDGSAALSTPLTTWTWCSGTSGSQYVEGCTLAGYKVSGNTDGYTSNSVFFPAAGYSKRGSVIQDSHGYYWSSTPGSSTSSYLLLFYESYQNVGTTGNRNFGYSVRAVLEE